MLMLDQQVRLICNLACQNLTITRGDVNNLSIEYNGLDRSTKRIVESVDRSIRQGAIRIVEDGNPEFIAGQVFSTSSTQNYSSVDDGINIYSDEGY